MASVGNERLDSWKEIAEYLRRDITTVIRWEREKGLPVHRVPGGKRHAVFAYRQQIDAWLANGDSGARNGAASQAASSFPSATHAGETPALRPTGSSPAGGPDFGAPMESIGLQKLETPTNRGRLLTPPRISVLPWLPVAALVLVFALLITNYLARPVPVPKISSFIQLTNDGCAKGGGLVTDGGMLYFVESTAQGRQICRVPVSDGEATPISGSFSDPSISGLDRKNSALLVLDGASTAKPGTLWALPVSGGEPTRVGDVVAYAAAMSPDGQTLAYSNGQSLYLSKPDGSESRRVVSLAGRIGPISWSPGGQLLRFGVDPSKGGVSRIWQVSAGGSGLRTLLAGWHESESQVPIQWTPSGKYFLYSAGADDLANVWALPEERGILGRSAGAAVQLTFGPEIIGACALSPEGKKLFVEVSQGRHELVRFDPTTKQFENYLPGISADGADFSRDGKWVAYTVSNNAALWRRRRDGSQPLQLTFPPMQVELPRWSPDGKLIAFMAAESPNTSWKVYLVPFEGGKPRALQVNATNQGAPTWSPDGAKLAFGDLINKGNAPVNQAKIHIFDLKTRETTDLPGSGGLWTSRWSPNGNQMAALTADSRTVMVFSAWIGLTPDGSPLVSRVTARDEIFSAQWQEP
ncbi:MAG: hypothetical protein DMG22_10585 [Acidobacteria bacterium]|nr:MAG: hypothetical protein DMG22_10585 [Acidobacteriota bacterium]